MNFLTIIVNTFLVAHTAFANNDNFYHIVIDGGSTGSRAFVYHFYEDDSGKKKVTGIEGKKVTPGISDFAAEPQTAASYLTPVVLDCKSLIPELFHKSTVVHFKATAGMRLLKENEQSAIFQHLVDGLANNSDIPFVISGEFFGIIDGRHEAYYAVLASNFIIGRLDTNLKPVDGLPMVGALDMGGSSTQIVFHTGTSPGEVVKVDDFWSHSFLSYGVDAIRTKLWNEMALTYTGHSTMNMDSEESGSSSQTTPRAVNNPCLPVGYEELSSDGQVVLIGDGDAEDCSRFIRKVLWPDDTCLPGSACPIDGVMHPPVDGLQFFAMSVYFFALDCIRELGTVELPSWPNPTIDELKVATHKFCELPWSQLQNVQDDHKYTQSNQMAHRCLQTLYLGILLEEAFGFSRDFQGITLAHKVEGNEVQWTLGYALAELLPSYHDSTVAESVSLEASVDGSFHEVSPGASHTDENIQQLMEEFDRLHDIEIESRRRQADLSQQNSTTVHIPANATILDAKDTILDAALNAASEPPMAVERESSSRSPLRFINKSIFASLMKRCRRAWEALWKLLLGR